MGRLRQTAIDFLCSAFGPDRADELSVHLQDMYEQLRSDGRSILYSSGSCATLLIATYAGGCWSWFASRPQPDPSEPVLSGRARFLQYCVLAVVTAFLAGCYVWLTANSASLVHFRELRHRPPFVGVDFQIQFVLVIMLVVICRTAYARAEYFPLAILYVAAKGALFAFAILLAIHAGCLLLGTEEPRLVFQQAFVLFGTTLNVYAKYLSPDCARAE